MQQKNEILNEKKEKYVKSSRWLYVHTQAHTLTHYLLDNHLTD